MTEESTSQRELEQHDADGGRAGAVDWARIHERLEAAQAALERRMTPEREKRESILRARARLLAREPEREQQHGGSLAVVEFLLGDERHAIESSYIREIQPLRDLTPLPCVPPFVLGLINVRGQILPVIDIKALLDFPPRSVTDLSKVIVVQSGKMELGILADAILGARSISLRQLQPPLHRLTGVVAKFLRGITDDSVIVLDLERLLSDSRIIVDESAPGRLMQARSTRGDI
jgi:purine-binding chemotaxis protein CheW